MGLIAETAGVFAFLRGVYDAFPVAIRLLINGTFGGMVYLAILRHFNR